MTSFKVDRALVSTGFIRVAELPSVTVAVTQGFRSIVSEFRGLLTLRRARDSVLPHSIAWSVADFGTAY